MNDFTNVDVNVTRFVPRELKRPFTWQTLVLHYLGVDHIGHTLGGQSPLIQKKLTEIDVVIGEIYTAMQETVDIF